MNDKCLVTLNGDNNESEDFVAVLANEDGEAILYYNTDALTLGMAMKMVAEAFVDAMRKLTDAECEEVKDILSDLFTEGEDYE